MMFVFPQDEHFRDSHVELSNSSFDKRVALIILFTGSQTPTIPHGVYSK